MAERARGHDLLRNAGAGPPELAKSPPAELQVLKLNRVGPGGEKAGPAVLFPARAPLVDDQGAVALQPDAIVRGDAVRPVARRRDRDDPRPARRCVVAG